ncbi:MAG: hypothetical protein CMF69_08230 [Magnetovibrio sp.]|nr:hypothetical protein [Magnetovibrio sp.]|tara:strand:- start:82 stop:567 length:486 start_codon:yes stop_codon:yes gene_type:complete
MVRKNRTVAGKLNPPFIVSLSRDRNETKRLTNLLLRPSDQMTSLASTQKGFLGLETMRDKRGEWFTLTFWQNLQDFNTWRKICKKEVALAFHGEPFESFCSIKVARVERIKKQITKKTTRHLKAHKPQTLIRNSYSQTSWFSKLLSIITEFFDHASIRQSK